jgi:ectoine hydroxylase-related dioxygenase (phytanoyl-CoA dioxygenase family)
VRDYLHFRPQAGFRPSVVVGDGLDSAAMAADLDARGIHVAPRLLDAARLDALRDAFERVITGPDGRPLGATNAPGAYGRFVDLSQWPVFLDLVLREAVLAAVEAYYRRPIYLAATQVNRLEPVAPFEGDSFQWHHDMKGKYVKAMWLLTDVAADGQRMSFVAGSHRRLRSALTYEESRIPAEAARTAGEIVECVGPAGTLILFDTNGIHRGNRNPAARRDIVFGIYSAGRHLHGCRFDSAAVARLSPFQRAVLMRSQSPSKGYASIFADMTSR